MSVACGGNSGGNSDIGALLNGQSSGDATENDLINVGNDGSQTGGKATVSSTGSVTILMTDGPSQEFDRIEVTVTGVSLLGGESGAVDLFEGEETFDLLALKNFSEVFVKNDAVPVGTYSKIRLYVSKVQLITEDENGEVSETIDADLPANGHIDLNPRGEFEVAPDSNVLVTIDIDANKAIKAQAAGKSGKYKFRPVVFVEIESAEIEDEDRRLTQFTGVVTEEFDAEAGSFLLCSEMNESQVCYDILVDEATSLFNDEPVSILPGDLVVGGQAKVTGWLQDDTEGLEILAAVVEFGESGAFSLTTGIVSTPYDTESGTFAMMVDDTEVVVSLAEGAKLFTQDGAAVKVEDLLAGDEVEVSGIAGVGETITATLVFVHVEQESESYSGEVTGVTLTGLELTSGEETKCVEFTTDTEVQVASESEMAGASIADLILGLTVEAYGSVNEETGCIEADKIIIESEESAEEESEAEESEE